MHKKEKPDSLLRMDDYMVRKQLAYQSAHFRETRQPSKRDEEISFNHKL